MYAAPLQIPTVLHSLLLAFLYLRVTKADAPKIQPFSFPEHSSSGDKVTVFCAVRTGEPPFTFTWLKDGQEIKDSTNIDTNNIQDYSNLVINPVTIDSIGNYTCVVRNQYGIDKYTDTLTVEVPPTWLKVPEDSTVTLGGHITLPCSASGYPVPTISWRRTGHRLSKENFYQPLESEKGNLVLPDVKDETEGYYVCEAHNGIGEGLRRVVYVSVNVPARFEEKFVAQNVKRGDSAVLKCDAIGDKPMTVIWSKDKRVIDFTKLTRIEKFDREQEKGVNSELVIRTTDRNDGAMYMCSAKNEYGNDERSVKLQVVEVPAQPLDVKVEEAFSRRAKVKWSESYNGNSPITKYIVQYWRDRGGAHRLFEETVPNSQKSVQLESLHPGTPYSVTVVAENDIGQGEPSDVLQFVTGEEEPSSPPTDVWIQPKGSSSIVVSWKPPPREYWNGELKGYHIGYKVDSFSQPHAIKTVDSTKNETFEYTLKKLMKSTKYSVVVKAYNSAGAGPPSQELVAKTLDGDLPEPPPLKLHGTSDSAISLRWGETPSKNIPVTGYTLHYKKEHGEWYHVPIIASASNRFTVTGLDRGTTYNVYITASNQYGNGEPGDIIDVKTSTLGFGGGIPFYLDLSIIIPVATCLLAFLVIIIVIVVYIRKSRARRNLEKAMQEAKPHTYSGTSQRYIDINKARPTNEMGAPGISYATMPPRDESLGPQNIKDRPLPYPKPVSLPKKGNSRFYDTAE